MVVMKILIYTVTDFSSNASNCIRLLYDSIDKSEEFDFLVMATKPPEDFFEFKYIVDPIGSPYAGILKFSEKIPEGYDKYIYLDSDILFYGKASDLFTIDKKISIVKESRNMLVEWHRYPYADHQDISLMSETSAINAGTFSFSSYKYFKGVRDLFFPFISGFISDNAKLEQQAFNYFVAKTVEFNLDACFDLTEITQLFAQQFAPSEKKLYHFCGFTGEMSSKYINMKKFNDDYKRRNN